MRQIDLTGKASHGEEERLARLVRHLDARLRDFGPGGPEVLQADQRAGLVSARFPGHDTGQVLDELGKRGISAVREGGAALFYLSPQIRFEDLDYVWGCLNQLL